MNVTDVPEHMVVVGVVILTDGTTDGLTVIVIELDVPVAGTAQLAVEVMTHDTICPVVSVVVVYVALFVPTLVPFTFH